VQQFAIEKEEKKAVDQVTGLYPASGKFEQKPPTILRGGFNMEQVQGSYPTKKGYKADSPQTRLNNG